MTIAGSVDALSAIAERLEEIASEVVGSNRLALNDEIRNLRAIIKTCRPKQAIPEVVAQSGGRVRYGGRA